MKPRQPRLAGGEIEVTSYQLIIPALLDGRWLIASFLVFRFPLSETPDINGFPVYGFKFLGLVVV